ETKLQHGHTGNLQPIAQRVHGRSDVAQILGKKRQSPQRLAQLQKQIIARTIDPPAIDRGRVRGRNLPELIESAKVIEADVVTVLRRPAEPPNPPVISLRLHHVPAVKRIPPALAGLDEEIRR